MTLCYVYALAAILTAIGISMFLYTWQALGFLGVDIVIDRKHGRLILEMIARPGLNIQIANCAGLAHRIDRIGDIFEANADYIARARIARREFAAQRQTTLPLNGTL